MTVSASLQPGFQDPVGQSQAVFRELLQAMARPGRIVRLSNCPQPQRPLSTAATAICLALADIDTKLWIAPDLATPQVEAFLRFHCGCPLTADPAEADFALAGGGDLPPLPSFRRGEASYPETSTTVIVHVDRLVPEAGFALSGPGIETEHHLRVDGLRDIGEEWRENAAVFPLGVDLMLVAGDRVAALPRTVAMRPAEAPTQRD